MNADYQNRLKQSFNKFVVETIPRSRLYDDYLMNATISQDTLQALPQANPQSDMRQLPHARCEAV